MAVLNVALYWVVIPYRTQQRFMLHALGLAVVPLAATLDRGRWLRIGATVLLALHILTPQTWPFAAREAEIPWDLSPLIPNAIGSLVALFPRLEPARSTRADGPRPPAVRPAFLGCSSCAILMVWAWRRACDSGPSADRDGAWPDRWRPRLTLAFLGLGLSRRSATGHFDPMLRFYPPFRDFYAGWRNFDAYCGPRGARVAYAGTNIPYYLLGPGLRNEVRYVNVDGHRDWLLHDYHREAMARGQGPGRTPGRAGTGSGPTIGPGWTTSTPRGSSSWSSPGSIPPKGAHNVADAEGSPSSADGPTPTPSGSSGSTARRSATPGSGSTG